MEQLKNWLRRGWQRRQPRAVTAKIWKWPRSNKILLGLVVGVALGLLVERTVTDPEAVKTLEWWLANVIQPLGRLFIRIIFMIVIPLIFSAFVLGVAEMGDVRKLGRVGLKSMFFTLLLSGTSVLLGLTLVNVLEPGKQLSAESKQMLTEKYQGEAMPRVEQGQPRRRSQTPCSASFRRIRSPKL